MQARTLQGFVVLVGVILTTSVPAVAQKPDDDVLLHIAYITLPLPVDATVEETKRAMEIARAAMSRVHECKDLLAEARSIKPVPDPRERTVRVGDLVSIPQMYEELPKLAPGQTAGPYRVHEGLQVVAVCSKSDGKN
jgi:peptidyl-prolyl cis-trans isomerase SurA